MTSNASDTPVPRDRPDSESWAAAAAEQIRRSGRRGLTLDEAIKVVEDRRRDIWGDSAT